MIGQTISHYLILEKLGEGGMGVVYKAEDTKLKRTVALKFLTSHALVDKDQKARFIREARAAAALDHPNICTVYDISEADQQTFISMAYIEGQSLKGKIDSGPLKLGEALEIAIQITGALHDAHERGIVHRDIKSDNIMVTPKGQVKIMDFGLAKLRGSERITKTKSTIGTVAYMSPEQAQAEAVDHRTDIWSLGVVLYEMVAGQLPFKGEYEQAVVYSILNEEPDPITGLRTGVPMELERIVNKALAKTPDERYQHDDEMLIDLKAVKRQLETGPTEARLAATPRRQREATDTFVKDLLKRRVPQILGIYVALSWGITRFMEWAVSRYVLSPNLPDFGLVALASMIPTVFLLANFHRRPGPQGWTRVEKIGIPVNLMASVILLFFLFSSKGLGAATTTISLENEEGQKIERVIPKSEFRKKIALFFFENESGDSTLNWLQYAISGMLEFDLIQDLFLYVEEALSDMENFGFYEKMKEVGFSDGVGLPLTLQRKIADDLHLGYFVTGSFTKRNDTFWTKSSLYETKRGKLIAETTFSGTDLFRLVDEIAVQIKHDLEIPEGHLEEVRDLPVAEMLTSSITAQKSYTAGLKAIAFDNDWQSALEHLEQSVREDPTFAYAQYCLWFVYLASNQSEKAEGALQSAMQHLYKLPERFQFSVKDVYYFMRHEENKRLALAKMHVELSPEDVLAHSRLAFLYRNRNQLEEAISEYERILELDPEQYDYLQTIGYIYEKKGEFEEALKYYEQYARQFPDDHTSFTAIGDLYETIGDHDQSKSYYEKALLIDPENISVLRQLAKIESNRGHFEEAVQQYQEALRISKTPRDSSAVYSSLRSLYELKGQLDRAVHYMHLRWAEDEKFENPLQVQMNKLTSVSTYVRAGKQNLALQTIQSTRKQLAPPWDKLLPLGYLDFYLELEDADNAEKASEGVETIIQTFQMEAMRSYVLHAQGQIHEMRGEYEEAILSYQKELELDPTDASINGHIGRCYRNLKEFEKAEEFLQKNLRLEPFSPKVHYEIALVYSEMGRKEKGLEHLKKALYVWEDADPEYEPAKKANEKLAEWQTTS